MIPIRASTETGLRSNFDKRANAVLTKSSSWTPPMDEPLQHHPTSTIGRPSVEVCVKPGYVCEKPLTELLRQVVLAYHLNAQGTQQDLQHPSSSQMDI